MRRIPRWIVAASVGGMVMLVAACAGKAGPDAPGPDGWPSGRSFIATSVTEDGAAKAIIEGTEIRVDFRANGELGANAGCNTLGGAGRIESGTLVVDDLWMTEMGCPDGRMAQERWLIDFLTSRPTLRLDGDELTLASDTVTIVLLDREIADPDRPLVGTSWTVTTVFLSQGAAGFTHPVPAVLAIDDSTGSELSRPFVATTGCVGGEVRGTAAVSGSSVTFAITDERPCIGRSNEVDQEVRAMLSGEATFEIEAAHLRLLRPDGTGLGLSAEPSGDEQVEVDCGTVMLDQGEQVPVPTLTCFLDAVAAGQTVRLTVIALTVEGDPILTTYDGNGEGRIHVTVDGREDRFGSGQVEYQFCEGPTIEEGGLSFAECTPGGNG